LPERERQLRALVIQHHNDAIGFLPKAQIEEHLRRLRLLRNGRATTERAELLTLAIDLAVYTAAEGRSRGLQRYARARRPALAGDAARVLDAMEGARFSLWRVERPHEEGGLIVRDLMRQTEDWLMDERLAAAATPGTAFASRLFEPDRFAMTCGVVVPVDRGLIEEIGSDPLPWRRGEPADIANDPRFAVAVYRSAIGRGLLEQVRPS